MKSTKGKFEAKRLKVGDRVWWTTSYGGSPHRVMRGMVVEVVEVGTRPGQLRERKLSGCGLGRAHESYVVEVQEYRTRPARYFWPVVSRLNLDDKQ